MDMSMLVPALIVSTLIFGGMPVGGYLIYRVLFPTEHTGSTPHRPYGFCSPDECRCRRDKK